MAYGAQIAVSFELMRGKADLAGPSDDQAYLRPHAELHLTYDAFLVACARCTSTQLGLKQCSSSCCLKLHVLQGYADGELLHRRH
jgi:hypothetical protein